MYSHPGLDGWRFTVAGDPGLFGGLRLWVTGPGIAHGSVDARPDALTGFVLAESQAALEIGEVAP